MMGQTHANLPLVEAIERDIVPIFLRGPHETATKAVSIVVEANSTLVHQRFIECIWKRGGGLLFTPKILREGDEWGQGLVRDPGGFGMIEVVTRVDKGRILEYCIPQGLPISTHWGIVNFEQLEENVTKITWVMHYTPTIPGRLGFGLFCEYLLYPYFLHNLKKDLGKN